MTIVFAMLAYNILFLSGLTSFGSINSSTGKKESLVESLISTEKDRYADAFKLNCMIKQFGVAKDEAEKICNKKYI
jgi:hypothetical protein